jgi:hypothetical protein
MAVSADASRCNASLTDRFGKVWSLGRVKEKAIASYPSKYKLLLSLGLA